MSNPSNPPPDDESGWNKWSKSPLGIAYQIIGTLTFLVWARCAYRQGSWGMFFVALFFSYFWPLLWLYVIIQKVRKGDRYSFCERLPSKSAVRSFMRRSHA
jgi:hypothetical protein